MKHKKQQKNDSIKDIYLEAFMTFKNIFLNDSIPPVNENDLQIHFSRSTYTLGLYSTLDWQHINTINIIRKKIEHYYLDKSLKRPLNFMLISEPGLGKSFFIKCLAERMKSKGIEAVTYNMSSLQNNDDLIHPLDSIRNLKVRDIIPILFLDEFDSHPEKISILLPLLWDGEFHFTSRDIKLGKVIIILGGSNYELMSLRFQESDSGIFPLKTWDLFSRINGGFFEIPSLELVKEDRDRRVDKICISISLLKQRFGKNLQIIPWSILKFIGNTKFKFGVRSIAHLVDLIPHPKNFTSFIDSSDLILPISSLDELKESSLFYHISLDQNLQEIINLWKNIKNINAKIRISSPEENEFI